MEQSPTRYEPSFPKWVKNIVKPILFYTLAASSANFLYVNKITSLYPEISRKTIEGSLIVIKVSPDSIEGMAVTIPKILFNLPGKPGRELAYLVRGIK